MSELTAEEKTTVRDAALGAMALVSRADPGFFATFKESMAGSKTLTAAPEGVRALFKADGLPTSPKGSADEVAQHILESLQSAMTVLRTKAPEQAEGFSTVVLQACDAVANASKGVAPEEASAIQQIRQALGSTGPSA